MLEDEDPCEHELALGNTRPAMVPYLNIPLADCVFFAMAALEAIMFRWQLLIPIGIVFVGSWWFYRKDYNAGRVFVSWCATSGRHLGAADLGGSYISPDLVAADGTFRGIIAR